MKKCTRCRKTYENPAGAFWVDNRLPDGLTTRCIRCRKETTNAEQVRRRAARRSERTKNKNVARSMARQAYDVSTLKCAVLNCAAQAEDLHHVNYELALDVVPFCAKHHKMDHDLLRDEKDNAAVGEAAKADK